MMIGTTIASRHIPIANIAIHVPRILNMIEAAIAAIKIPKYTMFHTGTISFISRLRDIRKNNETTAIMAAATPKLFYAVVYGDTWEDIQYFSSFHKARANLVIQTRFKDNSFHPILIGYSHNNSDDRYGSTRNYFGIKRYEELFKWDEVTIKQNPELAFDLIEMIF
jgi:hypothetical protein